MSAAMVRAGGWNAAALCALLLVACGGDPKDGSDAGGGADARVDAGPPPTPLERLRSGSAGPAEVVVVGGLARTVRGRFDAAGAPEDAARGFLGEHAEAFGVEDPNDLALRAVREDELARVVIFDLRRGEQPVFGAEVRVGFDPGGALVYVGARLPGPIEVAADAALGPAEAAARAASELEGELTDPTPYGSAALGIFVPSLWSGQDAPPALAYRVTLGDVQGQDAVAFVDATDGRRLAWALETRAARERVVGECDDGAAIDECAEGAHRLLADESGPVVDASDPRFGAAQRLHELLGLAYDYFWTTFSRDSHDDAGAPLRAFYSGTRSSGGPWWNQLENAIEIADPDHETADLIIHELTHGITSHATTAPIPVIGGRPGETQDVWISTVGETGALGESISDAFACLAGGDWRIDRNTGPERDLAAPTNAHYDEISSPGAIYANSGVPSMALYLLSEGGANPGRIGEPAVAGIGARKVESILYRAVTLYLDRASRFVDFRFQMLRACEDLIGRHGIVLEDCGELLQAFAAVGVGGWDHDRDLWADDCANSGVECVEVDNCPPDTEDPAAARVFANPLQEDSDFDDIGDLCEAETVDGGVPDAGPGEGLCPRVFPGDTGDIPLRDELGPSAWPRAPDQASSVTCAYQTEPTADAVVYTLWWVHTDGPQRAVGCVTHTPQGTHAHCGESVQAGVSLNGSSRDDGFEDAAERRFLPTLLSRIEPLAIPCPAPVFDDSPCPAGRIRCPAELVHDDGRVLPLSTESRLCPVELEPGRFQASCTFHEVECSLALSEPPPPGAGILPYGYFMTWAPSVDEGGSFPCTESQSERFGGTEWVSGTHRASVFFVPPADTPTGIEEVALGDGRAQAELRAAACP